MCSGIVLGSRSSEGQIDLSMMYMHDEPIIVLILSGQHGDSYQKRISSPEIDKTEHQSGDNGKVGKVETHGRPGGNGEGNVVSGTDGTVERDGGGNDDVADGTDGLARAFIHLDHGGKLTSHQRLLAN